MILYLMFGSFTMMCLNFDFTFCISYFRLPEIYELIFSPVLKNYQTCFSDIACPLFFLFLPSDIQMIYLLDSLTLSSIFLNLFSIYLPLSLYYLLGAFFSFLFFFFSNSLSSCVLSDVKLIHWIFISLIYIPSFYNNIWLFFKYSWFFIILLFSYFQPFISLNILYKFIL